MILADVIGNTEKLYEGDLVHYFRALMQHARNLGNPYHNFRHMLQVTWRCYEACAYYRDQLTPREMRTLLLAALFHDFNHSGNPGRDYLNIDAAITALLQHVLPEDEPYSGDIALLIRSTEYPHKIKDHELTLMGQILRDADMSQAISNAWIQEVVFGLAAEWGVSPTEMLRRTIDFHSRLSFITEWAQIELGNDRLADKAREARALLDLLEEREE